MDGYLLICTYFQMKIKYQQIKKKLNVGYTFSIRELIMHHNINTDNKSTYFIFRILDYLSYLKYTK